WVVYALFLACLGVWFSLVSRTTLRATVWTLLAVFGCMTLPLAIAAISPLIGLLFGFAMSDARVTEMAFYGGSPPLTFSALTFYWGDLDPRLAARSLDRVQAALLGLCCYGGAAAFLWRLLNRWFPHVTGRIPAR